MTDPTAPLSPTPVAPAAPAATTTDLFAAPLTPEAARLQIESLKLDSTFYRDGLNNPDPKIAAAAKARWSELHKTAFPPPPQVTIDNVNDAHENQHARRLAERMELGIAALRQMGITDPKALDEVRRQQPVAAAEQEIAREEIAQLKADKAWVRRYLDGDREAKALFTRLHQVISLPTSREKTTYPVK